MISNKSHNILYLIAGAYIGYLGIKIWKGIITGEATSNPILLGLFATLFIVAAGYLLFISVKYFMTHKEDTGNTTQTEEEVDETALPDAENDEGALPDASNSESSLSDAGNGEGALPDAGNSEGSLPNAGNGESSLSDAGNGEGSLPDADNGSVPSPGVGDQTALSDVSEDSERP